MFRSQCSYNYLLRIAQQLEIKSSLCVTPITITCILSHLYLNICCLFIEMKLVILNSAQIVRMILAESCQNQLPHSYIHLMWLARFKAQSCPLEVYWFTAMNTSSPILYYTLD